MASAPGFSKGDAELAIENFELYTYFRERLINLALSQFEWHNLPHTVDRYYMERMLLENGSVGFYMPQDTDFWVATSWIHGSGSWDMYGQPKGWIGVDFNQNHHTPDEENCFLLFDNNNEARQGLLAGINLHARRLYEVEQTFRSNLKHQNSPYIIAVEDEGEKNSATELFKDIFNFKPVLKLRRRGSSVGKISDNVDTLNTGVPYLGKDLLETRQMVWADALAMLGISAQTAKKERMLDDELTLNRQENMVSLQSRLLNRTEFCNKLNEKYGWEMSVNLSDRSIREDELMGTPFKDQEKTNDEDSDNA